MDRRTIITVCVAIYVGYIVKELWTLLPATSFDIIYPFPYSTQGLPRPTHVWIMCIYIFLAILAFGFYRFSHHWYFEISFVLQFAELVEYLMNYNERWFHGLLNIAIIRFVILGICIAILLTKHTRSDNR